jgi:hypothetical protein
VLSLAVAALVAFAASASAQYGLDHTQRSQDGTVYEVISVDDLPMLLGGAEEVRITTLGGSVNGFQNCSASGIANQPVTAGSGVEMSINQFLHPLNETVRTAVLTVGDASLLEFTPIGSGRLTIGSGANKYEICRESNYCGGPVQDAAVMPLSMGDTTVPAACVATYTCTGHIFMALGFGLPQTGGICTSQPTFTTTICGPRPADGFTVGKGQVVVFIYNHSLGTQPFSIGAAGFGIDTDGMRIAGCSGSNLVVAGDPKSLSSPPRAPLPSQKAAPALSTIGLTLTAALLVLFGLVRVAQPIRISSKIPAR